MATTPLVATVVVVCLVGGLGLAAGLGAFDSSHATPVGMSSPTPTQAAVTPAVTDTFGTDSFGTDSGTYGPEPTETPAGDVTVQVPATVTGSDQAGAVLSTYFSSINRGDYQTAYAQLGPNATANLTFDTFSAEEASSQISNVEVEGAGPGPQDGTVLVDLDFTSNQDLSQSPDDSSCDQWALEYTIGQDPSGRWLIDNAEGRNGAGYTPC